ncbi:MAG TPA: hypothetical protein VGM64_12085 [Lacunisphaera sp.]
MKIPPRIDWELVMPDAFERSGGYRNSGISGDGMIVDSGANSYPI